MDVKILQSDMEDNMKNSVRNIVSKGFKIKSEYEDIAKFIKDECDKQFGEEFLCIVVDKNTGFGSCLKCAPGSLFMGEYQKNRVIVFRI